MSSKRRYVQFKGNKSKSLLTCDDTKENHGNNGSLRMITNPYVVLIGIADYDKPYVCIPAVSTDILNMKELWTTKYKYKHISCMNDIIGSTYITKKQLQKYMNKTVAQINQIQYNQFETDIDGLLFVYSGHGGIDKNFNDTDIICSDGQGLSLINDIQNKFAIICDSLENKPKIFYMDCCRGRGQQIDINNVKIAKGNHILYTNPLTDFYVHYATSDDHVSYADQNPMAGSYFTSIVYKHYTDNIYAHQQKTISLQDTSIKINAMINKKAKGIQTAEVMNRLTYHVYITPSDAENKSPLTKEMLTEENAMLKQEVAKLRNALQEIQYNYNKTLALIQPPSPPMPPSIGNISNVYDLFAAPKKAKHPKKRRKKRIDQKQVYRIQHRTNNALIGRSPLNSKQSNNGQQSLPLQQGSNNMDGGYQASYNYNAYTWNAMF